MSDSADYLEGVPTLSERERRAALLCGPVTAHQLSERIYEVAAAIRARRPADWRFAFGSQPSERLAPEVRAELEELLAAGDTPYVAAERLDISYRAARRAMQKRERRVDQEWCETCRCWVIAPCMACRARISIKTVRSHGNC